MTFQDLKVLAWAKVPRSDSTAALYALEEQASEAIAQAAREIGTLATTRHGEALLSHEEAIALELVAALGHFGRSGSLAARIVVDRYGIEQD